MREERVGHRVAALGARQEGVVGRAQLLALDLSSSAIGRLVAAGRLLRVHRGVYAVGHVRTDLRSRCWAAVLACGPGAALSHRTAAALWDLPGGAGGTVEVSVPVAGGRRARSGVCVHRTAALTPAQVTAVDGLPVTRVERTLLDLALVVTPRVLGLAVEAAEHRGLFDHARLPDDGSPGSARVRAALAEPATRERSWLERRFLALCRRAGLPAPLVNARVEGLEVDVHWPAARVVVETDGGQHHRTRRAFEEDRRRDAHLVAAGWRVLRFTHDQVVRDERHVVSTLRRVLDAELPPSGRNASRTAVSRAGATAGRASR